MIVNHGGVHMLHNQEQVLILDIDLDLYEQMGDLVVLHQSVEHQGDFIVTNEYQERIPFIRNGAFCYNHLIIEAGDVFYKQFPMRTRNKMKILDLSLISIVRDLSSKSPLEIENLYHDMREELRLYPFHNESIFVHEIYEPREMSKKNEDTFADNEHTRRSYNGILDSIRCIHWAIMSNRNGKQ